MHTTGIQLTEAEILLRQAATMASGLGEKALQQRSGHVG